MHLFLICIIEICHEPTRTPLFFNSTLFSLRGKFIMKDKFILEVQNPRSLRKMETFQGLTAPRPATLDGKRIAILSGLPEGEFLMKSLQELLQEKYSTGTFDLVFFNPMAPKEYIELLRSYDAFLEGVRLTGGSDSEPVVDYERAGIPGVHICVEAMGTQATFSALAHGLPAMRIVEIPTLKWLNAANVPENYSVVAEVVLDDIIHALTDPLTEEEKNPPPFEYDYSNRCFEGADYNEAFEKFQKYFMENDLTDGVAIAPPTPEAVKAMLAGTTRKPDEVIEGIMQPGRGIVTIEKIAINAVMAGARPEYLPVIITAVEMVCDPKFFSWHTLAAINSDNLLISVGGPIAKEIGMTGRGAYFGPGNQANNSIGRAVSLCTRNLGWVEYEVHGGMYGQPSRFCNLVFCENEDESPWESYPVSLGFNPEDSTVMVEEVFHLDGVFQLGNMAMPSGPWTHGLQADMERIAEKARGEAPNLEAVTYGTANIHMQGARGTNPLPLINGRTYALILYPGLARQLAEAGYTRESLARFIADYKGVPWEDLGSGLQEGLIKLAKSGVMPGVTLDICKPGGKIPVMNSSRLAIFVAGHMYGQTIGMMCMGSYGGMFSGGTADPRVPPYNIKKVTGATLTKAGR
jgi:hypothetical protein